MPDVPVYCLMVTGKSTERLRFARRAVRDFERQRYPHKRLVIVNHHPTPVLDAPAPGIEEIQTEKGPGITLGDLRNTALDRVPADALWTTWDDDDLRHRDFLGVHARVLFRHGLDLVTHTTRIEHNQRAGAAWARRLATGSWIYFARRLPVFRYFSRDYGEDSAIRRQCARHRLRAGLIDNRDDATLYVRTIHGDNSSLKVDPGQTGPRGDDERPLRPREEAWLAAQLAIPW
jgi:hypothetical protein